MLINIIRESRRADRMMKFFRFHSFLDADVCVFHVEYISFTVYLPNIFACATKCYNLQAPSYF